MIISSTVRSILGRPILSNYHKTTINSRYYTHLVAYNSTRSQRCVAFVDTPANEDFDKWSGPCYCTSSLCRRLRSGDICPMECQEGYKVGAQRLNQSMVASSVQKKAKNMFQDVYPLYILLYIVFYIVILVYMRKMSQSKWILPRRFPWKQSLCWLQLLTELRCYRGVPGLNQLAFIVCIEMLQRQRKNNKKIHQSKKCV